MIFFYFHFLFYYYFIFEYFPDFSLIIRRQIGEEPAFLVPSRPLYQSTSLRPSSTQFQILCSLHYITFSPPQLYIFLPILTQDGPRLLC